MSTPSIGRDVHYVARGSADGRFPKTCRAAKITEIGSFVDIVGLVVFSPSGFLFHSLADGGCSYDEAEHSGGSWHWPERVGE